VTTRDDELLDVLAASLGPAAEAEPSWAELSQLHRVLDTGLGDRRPNRSPIWRLRPVTAAVAGLFVLGGASAAAAVSGAVMPEPMRVAARAVGLPVDSPGLADARSSLAGLRVALAAQPRDVDTIRTQAQEVRDRVGRLSADDRFQIEDQATFLLAEADTALAPPPAPLGAPPGPNAATQKPPAPASPAAAPGSDHHGGDQPTSAPNQARSSDDQRSGDDHGGSAVEPSGSGVSGPAPSGTSGDGDHTATTIQNNTSGSDGGSSPDGGGSGGGSDGGSGGGSSGSDGGHSGPD